MVGRGVGQGSHKRDNHCVKIEFSGASTNKFRTVLKPINATTFLSFAEVPTSFSQY